MNHSPSLNEQRPSSRAPWFALATTVVPTALLMQIDKQAMAVLAPMIQRDYDIDLVTMTHILAASAWAYALFQLPAGWLAERLGAFRLLSASCIAWSFFVLLTPLASSIWTLTAFRFLMGAGQAPDWTASMMIVRRSFAASQRSRASSYLLGSLYLGTLISGPLSIAIGSAMGWQAVFYIYGAVGLFFGILLMTVMRPPPPLVTHDNAASQHDIGLPARRLAASPQVHALALSYFALVGIQSFFFTLLPLYLVGKRHVSLTNMGWLSSAPFLTLYLAVISAGVLADLIVRRTGSIRMARAPLAVASMLGSAVFFTIGVYSDSLGVMMIFLCLGSAMVGVGQVTIWSSVQDLAAGGSGLIPAWTGFLGHIALGLIPVVAAYIVRWTGDWNHISLVVASLGVFGSIAYLFVRSDRPIVA